MKLDCLFIKRDLPMSSLLYIISIPIGKDKKVKAIIAMFGNLLQQSLQEDMSITRVLNDIGSHYTNLKFEIKLKTAKMVKSRKYETILTHFGITKVLRRLGVLVENVPTNCNNNERCKGWCYYNN